MKYENPRVNNDVNVSTDSHATSFLKLIAAVAGISVVVVVLVYFLARVVAVRLPFSVEERLFSAMGKAFSSSVPSACYEQEEQARAYLQTLSASLLHAMNAKEDIRVKIHLSTDNTPNAFATLGGNIILTRGFLTNVHSENALTMVLAHEIAHVLHRDALASAGGGLGVTILFMLVTGIDGGWVANIAGNLTQAKFSRQQEAAADRAALEGMKNLYGHTAGADEFFRYILTLNKPASPPEFLSTHPATEGRIQAIIASQAGEKKEAVLMPYPAQVLSFMQCLDK